MRTDILLLSQWVICAQRYLVTNKHVSKTVTHTLRFLVSLTVVHMFNILFFIFNIAVEILVNCVIFAQDKFVFWGCVICSVVIMVVVIKYLT